MGFKEKIVEYNKLRNKMYSLEKEIKEEFGLIGESKGDGILQKIEKIIFKDQSVELSYKITDDGFNLSIHVDVGRSFFVKDEQIEEICDLLEVKRPEVGFEAGSGITITLKFKVEG